MTLPTLTPADWPAVSALLDEALALPEGERDTFVQSLAGEQAQFRDTLRALLAQAAGVETGDFLATLPQFTRVDAGAGGRSDPSGERGPLTELAAEDSIGPYRLISELGTGGMGAVWLAERADGTLKRKVALKLPRLVWAKGLAERMARERDILASLEHPHIARLYDAGVDQHGRPYLALEYVEGQPIDVYAKERGLSVRHKLDLLLQVCAAVAFAHSRLVVHRDLKPSNILVTEDGQVRLLDFGIAKLLQGERAEATALTQVAGRALTPDYASPEQVRGEALGTASDVYSLGVVAYELLAGQRPYKLKRGSAAELEEAIASVEPPLASEAATVPALKRALRGDLDAILNKALKKDPADRYASVDALADDLLRHARGHAVLARPDSRSYRLFKFCARYKVVVGAAIAVVLSLGAGLGVALWKADEAQKQARRAEDARNGEHAISNLYFEVLSRVAAWDVATFAKSGSVLRELKSTLADYERRAASRPAAHLALLRQVGEQLPFFSDDEGALEAARRYLAVLKAQKIDDGQPLRAYLMMGLALTQLGRTTEAETVLRQGLQEYPRSKRNSDAYSMASLELAKLRRSAGELTEARAILGEVAKHQDELDPLTRADVAILTGRWQIGYDDDTALRRLQETRADLLARPNPYAHQVAHNDLWIGFAALSAARADVAQRSFTDALKASDTSDGPSGRDSILALGGLSASLVAQGHFEEARERVHERLVAVAQRPNDYAVEHKSMLDVRLLEIEVGHGNAVAAAGLLSLQPKDVPGMWRNFELAAYARAQARARIWQGRVEEAVQHARGLLEALSAERRVFPVAMQMRVALIEAELARGNTEAASKVLAELQDVLTQQNATRTWLYRETQEWAAIVAVRSGRPAGDAVRQLEGFESSHPAGALPAPGQAAAIDSALRHAELLLAAGRKAHALDALDAVAAPLQRQHPQSPRRAAAARLAASAAS